MIKLLTNVRWRLCLVLCLYCVSSFAQPWLHSHQDADDTVNQLHVHVSENSHHDERGHDDNHRKDSEHTSTVQKYLNEAHVQSTANHLLLDSSSSVAYLPIQSKYGKVPSPVTACTQCPFQRDSEIIATAVTNTTENPPYLSLIYITSLTDLPPPSA